MIMAYDVYKVANTLLTLADKAGEPLSNMKLQKLLYYEQGYFLGYFHRPLFQDKIEAWLYGPVVPCVYDKYKAYGNRQIEPREADGLVEFQKDDERELFEQVYYVFSAYSAIGLMRMTHREAPWRDADCKRNEVIGRKRIQDFFEERIKRDEKEQVCC